MAAGKNLVPGSAQMLLLRLLAGAGHVWVSDDRGAGTALNDTFALKAGTLYPILHALEADGSIESYEQPGGAATAGKAAALLPYHTRAGRGALESAANGVAPGVPGDQRCVGNNGCSRRGGAVMGQTRKEWLQTVTAQLRCRRAVPGVERELENHLSEQYNAFVASRLRAGRSRAQDGGEHGRPGAGRRRAGPRAQAPPGLGAVFLWWRRCCWRVRCCVFLERARFGTRRTCGARARTKAWPPPWRNCCACGGIFLYGCVPVGTLDKGALYRAGGRFGLWFFWPDIP